jgi:translocation and assembly module TamB
VAVALGKDMLSRFGGAGSGVETTQSVVDRFDVEVGRGVTRSGDETVHVLFRMADDVLQPGGTLYLAGEKDVFGYYNGGVRIVFRFP